MDIDFQIEREWWNLKADREERDTGDESVNRALRWREIERNLAGVRTVLDIGAATGAFSIPLARRGLEVTHVDLSPAMLDLARQKADDLPNLHIVEGNSTDLRAFPDRSFDLVLNMDGAISFCGSRAIDAINEACRLTARKLILTVSHRACMIPVFIGSSISDAGKLLPAVQSMFNNGQWHQDEFPSNAELTKRNTGGRFAPLKAFLPGDLKAVLEQAGMRVLRVGGLGSLAYLCGADVVRKAAANADVWNEFLNLCDRFDAEILPDGPGTQDRAGLIAVAEPI
jgi:SAM-dependent methyltransferase